MNYQDLYDFIDKRMRMTHIYQPLLIKTLIKNGGLSSVRKIALEFLKYDESQIQFYERVVKRWPVRTLLNHNVIIKERNNISLSSNNLTAFQSKKLIELCETKLNQFLESRGLTLWDYRMIDDPTPNSLRYKVLKNSDYRCELCGATKYDRPLDVDHIIPRSRNGKTIEENLQVLCSKCNRSKRNTDKTDFRKIRYVDKSKECIFCELESSKRVKMKNRTVFSMLDKYPVTKDHYLIIPFRHTEDFFTMTEIERNDAMDLIRLIKNIIKKKDNTVLGFNIGMNCGQAAGQTVMHSHIHLIPRRKGDTPKPRGGVRGVIPSKMDY